MDDQTIKLGFQVDTAQVQTAAKAATQVKAAIDDVDAANDRAAKNAAARAGAKADKAAKEAKRAADAEIKEEERKAAEIQAIEDAYFMKEYRRQVTREANAQKASKKAIDDSWKEWEAKEAAAEKAADKIAQGTAGIGRGANSAAYKLQVLGQGLDDLQYVGEMGLRPIVNNLMQLSPALGIFAIAINSIGIPAIKSLMAAMESKEPKAFEESLDGIAKRIKELEDKKLKLAVDMEQLDLAKEKQDRLISGQKALDAIMGAQSTNEKESGAAISKAITETPGGIEALDAAKNMFVNEQVDNNKDLLDKRAQIDEQKQRKADAEKRFDSATTFEEKQAALHDSEDAEENVKILVNEFKADLDDIVKTSTAVFGDLFKTAVSGKGIEQLKAQKEITDRIEAAAKIDNSESGLEIAGEMRKSTPMDMARASRAKQEEKDAKEKDEAASKLHKQEMEEEENRQRVAKEEAAQDTKTSKALGKAPPTAEEIAKKEKKDADFDASVNEAGQKADQELLGLKTRSGASIADLYAQQRMQISMLPKNRQAKAMQQLDAESQQAVMQALIAKGAMPAEAQFKSGSAAGRLDRIFRLFSGQSGEAAAVPAPRPKRVLGKRNRGIAALNAAKHAKTVGPRKVGADKAAKDSDKSVSLQSDMAKSLARIEANTGDALRAKNIAILG